MQDFDAGQNPGQNAGQKSSESPPIVISYGPAGINIAEQLWSGSILLLPSKVQVWHHGNPLKVDDFNFINENEINEDFLLIIGTGSRSVFLDQQLEKSLQKRSVPFEVMATSAACRCYNLLLAEGGRRLVAALLPI